MVYYFLFLIDGFGYDQLQNLKNNQSLINTRSGNSNTHCRYVKPILNEIPTITSPNWVTILTGLPVKTHKIMNNAMVGRRNFKFKPSSIFDDQKTSSLFISDWKMMFKYITCKRVKCIYDRKPFVRLMKTWTRHKPKLTVVNTDQLDSIGHLHGWNSKQFKKKVSKIESFIFKFCKYLQMRKKVKFCIFITADHSGYRKNHENHNNSSIRKVPIITLSNDINCYQRVRRRLIKIRRTKQIRNLLQLSIR